MASSLFSEAFIIFNLNQYGQPAQIVPYWEDTATYVSVSISICRGMLRTPAVKDVFQNFMEMYHSQMSKDLVEFFISKILERFPLVFIDHSLTNPDYLAWHFRRVWNEDLKNFDTRKQALVINGLVSQKLLDLTSSMIKQADQSIESYGNVPSWGKGRIISRAGFRRAKAVPTFLVPTCQVDIPRNRPYICHFSRSRHDSDSASHVRPHGR